MHELLYRFLIRNKQVSFPGIGTIQVHVQSAQADIANRSFVPSHYSFVFEQGKETPSKKMFSWLAAAGGITDREAVIRFNDFVFDLKKQLDAGKEILWYGVGVFKKTLGTEIKFTPVNPDLHFQKPVTAEKIIRQNAGHLVRVGEEQKSSAEMTEMLSGNALGKKWQWWFLPLVIIILIFIFLCWYFSENGLNPAATGNNRLLRAAISSSEYKFLYR